MRLKLINKLYLETSIGLPVDSVDFANATDEQFQFTFVKWPQKCCGYELVEAFLQRQELLLDAAHKPV